MSVRLDQRVPFTEEIKVSGMDADGRMFEEPATVMDVTTTGARIAGIRRPLHRGCVIKVEYRSAKARFRVRWVGEAGSALNGQIGVQLIDSGKFIWGRVLPRVFEEKRSSADWQTSLSSCCASE